MGACPQCGAPDRDELTCRAQWDELLALEFSDARAGSVHFLTVACYQLQHPESFPLDPDVRQQLRGALHDVLVHDRPMAEIRDAVQRRYDGARRVRAATPAPARRQRPWSRTVHDVGPPDADHHVERVRAWARGVHRDLTDEPDDPQHH